MNHSPGKGLPDLLFAISEDGTLVVDHNGGKRPVGTPFLQDVQCIVLLFSGEQVDIIVVERNTEFSRSSLVLWHHWQVESANSLTLPFSFPFTWVGMRILL